jgi:hypothetical protein
MDIGSGQFGECKKCDRSKTFECCQKTCVPIVNRCRELCEEYFSPDGKTPDYKKYKYCMKDCHIGSRVCLDNCILALPSEYRNPGNPFDECVDQYCGNDMTCIPHYKRPILECCLNNCMSVDGVDCDTYCNMFVDQNVDPIKHNPLFQGLSKIPKVVESDYDKEENEKKGRKSKFTTTEIIVLTLVGIVFFFGLISPFVYFRFGTN